MKPFPYRHAIKHFRGGAGDTTSLLNLAEPIPYIKKAFPDISKPFQDLEQRLRDVPMSF
jgi:hypothetical protein